MGNTFLRLVAAHTVQGLNCVGGVDGLANLWRVFKYGAQVGPMYRPRFADLWILRVPGPAKLLQIAQGLILSG